MSLLTHPKAEPAMVILVPPPVPPRRGVTLLTLDVRLALYVYAPDIVDVTSSPCVAVTSHDTSPDPSLGGVVQMNAVAVGSVVCSQAFPQTVTLVSSLKPLPVTVNSCPPASDPKQ